MKFPKAERVEDPAYLEWCRSQECPWCRTWPSGNAHHVLLKKAGRAVVRDDWAVPACAQVCHPRCHGRTVTLRGNRLPPIPREEQLHQARQHRAHYLASRTAAPKQLVPF